MRVLRWAKVGLGAVPNIQVNLNVPVSGFDWDARSGNFVVSIPEAISDPCDLSVRQIQWLRTQNLIYKRRRRAMTISSVPIKGVQVTDA